MSSKLTVAQLKEECKKRGLETTGTKAVLVARLEAAPAAAPAAAPTPEAKTRPKRAKKEEEVKAEPAPAKSKARVGDFSCPEENDS